MIISIPSVTPALNKNEHKNVGHVINFKTEKEPKMKFFDFWAFKKGHFKKRQKLSHDKIIYYMLFEEFHNTSCFIIAEQCHSLTELFTVV